MRLCDLLSWEHFEPLFLVLHLWTFLEAASSLFFLWAARWICLRENLFSDGFLPWLKLQVTGGPSFLCVHMCPCGFFATWCLFKHLPPQIWPFQEPSVRRARWSEGEDSEFSINWLEKEQKKTWEILLLFSFFHYSFVWFRINLCPHKT